MKRIVFFFFAIIALSIGTSFAQADMKVTTGVVELQQGDCYQAVQSLRTGLSMVAEMKPKNVPKAWFSLGDALLCALNKAAQEKDMAKVTELKNAVVDAVEAYTKAKETDTEGKYTKQAEDKLANLSPEISRQALEMVHKSVEIKDPKLKAELLKEAARYAELCTRVTPNLWAPFEARAQVDIANGDSAAAFTHLATAAKNYHDKPPAIPTLSVMYIFYRKAVLDFYYSHNADQSLKTIEEGKAALESEYKNFQAKKDIFKPEAIPLMEENYREAKKDINALELQVYLSSPEKLQDALKRFDVATRENPTEYNTHVGYATLLEGVDKPKAIAMYERAIQIDPKQELAFFNLGALQSNIAKGFYDQANAEQDAAKSEAFKKEGDAKMMMAKPNFERALEINPKSASTVMALKQLSVTLNLMDDYKKYKDMETAIRSGGR